MNRFQAIGRLAVLVAGLAGALGVFCAGCVSIAVARVPVPLGSHSHRHPGPASLPPRPPGWNKHPPLPDPALIHAALAGTIPGWQLTLMAVTVVLLAATVVAIAYPGPGRTVAGERTHHPSGMSASGTAGVRPSRSADGGSASGTGTRRGAPWQAAGTCPPAVGAGMQAGD